MWWDHGFPFIKWCDHFSSLAGWAVWSGQGKVDAAVAEFAAVAAVAVVAAAVVVVAAVAAVIAKLFHLFSKCWSTIYDFFKLSHTVNLYGTNDVSSF